MAEDFMSGMKDAMSLFTMMSLASNYNAQQENMTENRELRAANMARQEREDKSQMEQRDFVMAGTLSNPKNDLPIDYVIPKLNQLAAKYSGGNQNVTFVTKDDYNTYLGQLDQTLKRADLTTTEARREALQPFTEKATEHPVFLRAFASRQPQADDFVQRPGVASTLQMRGFTPETTDKLLQARRPSEVMAMLDNKDTNALYLDAQADQTVEDVMNGKMVPEGQLARVLAASAGNGRKLGEKGGKIAAGPIGEQRYIAIQQEAEDFNKKLVQPFSQAWKLIDQSKAIKKMAFTSAIEDPMTALGSLLPPAQNKQFQTLAANLEAVHDKAQKDWTTSQRLTQLAKARIKADPENHTAADMILLDQQATVDRERANALMKPYLAVSAFKEQPTEKNFNAILGLSKELDATQMKWESDKQKIQTLSERATQETINEGMVKTQSEQATREFGAQAAALVGQHPEIAEGNGTFNAQKLAQLTAPLRADIEKKYPQGKVDVTSTLKELAGMSKPSVAPLDTDIKLSTEEATKFKMVHSGWQDTTRMTAALINENGSVNRTELLKAISGKVPWTSGRDLRSFAHSAIDAVVRGRTGAAVKEEEWPFYDDMYVPSAGDKDVTIKQKLQRLDDLGHGTVELVDPRGILRQRLPAKERSIEAIRKQGAEATQPAARGFDSTQFRALRKQYPKKSIDEIVDMMHKE